MCGYNFTTELVIPAAMIQLAGTLFSMTKYDWRGVSAAALAQLRRDIALDFEIPHHTLIRASKLASNDYARVAAKRNAAGELGYLEFTYRSVKVTIELGKPH